LPGLYSIWRHPCFVAWGGVFLWELMGQGMRQRVADHPAPAYVRTERIYAGNQRLGGSDEMLSAEAPLDPLGERLSRLAWLRRQRVDYLLLAATLGLLLLGLLMVYSASQFIISGAPAYWFERQLLWATLGLIALIVTARVDYHHWRRFAVAALGGGVILLLLTLRLGVAAYGAQRWLQIGVSVQPSEFMKLAFALYLADWLARKGDDTRTLLYGLAPFALLTGLLLTFILLQNDLGTSLIIAILAVAVFFTAGANPLHLAGALLAGGALYLAIIYETGFRRARLDAFLHPLPPGCAAANSYQICQGLISLGSGGLFGRGLGESIQKAGYLPNPFTDSIFAVIGEELGLLGCLTILALFAVLAIQGYRAGRRAPDTFGALLACGITTWLIAQAAINIGSVAAAIPFTGVPLPFVSFGGSSLVTSLAAVGVLLNIARQGSAERQARHTAD